MFGFNHLAAHDAGYSTKRWPRLCSPSIERRQCYQHGNNGGLSRWTFDVHVTLARVAHLKPTRYSAAQQELHVGMGRSKERRETHQYLTDSK